MNSQVGAAPAAHDKADPRRVSVVICTYNRADGLRQTLESLRQQRYREFEVVVVNGPSTDHTGQMLREYPRPITVVDNQIANLSVSRNLGIRAASGDIVAFIDDDALPEPAWLEQAVPHFDDPEVAGVGGVVLDHTGMAYQYRYSAATRFGETMTSNDEPYDVCCAPGAAIYPYLQGTNALFRRDLLGKIGLFDETFDFYLDETDVCCRLVDAGYLLRQLSTAVVHHRVLPSARRNESKAVTRWFSIMRNHVYFGYRHGLLSGTAADVVAHTHAFLESVLGDAAHHEARKDVEPGHTARTRVECEAAIAEGTRLGLARIGARHEEVDLPQGTFRPFLDDQPTGGLRILLAASHDDGERGDEIEDFIVRMGPALVIGGHEVRRFVSSNSSGAVVLEDGVWTHRLPAAVGTRGTSRLPRDDFAAMVANELARISEWWQPDVISGSAGLLDALRVTHALPAVPLLPLHDTGHEVPSHQVVA
jgi:glycosyltransferase involved in cell wall biosynthesis